ncbi:MAG: hypothetical protein WKF67_05565 [Rubrobacteraceae bacterium]
MIGETLATIFPDNPLDRYDLQEAYYEANGLYQALDSRGYGPGGKVRNLYNPAHRVVEFYGSHLWPEPLDELPLQAGKESVEKAARQVLEWSNWGQQKEIAARKLPTHGDLYLKAEDDEDSERAYIKLINPRYVTDFDKDPRGFATRVRLDIPITQNNKQRIRTEVYDKKRNLIAVWEHDRGAGAKEEDLGTPLSTEKLDVNGYNFIPFAHASFQNTGDERGVGAFSHALEPINELNKMASYIYDMVFVKEPWVLRRNESGGSAVSLEDLSNIAANRDGEDVDIGTGNEKRIVFHLPGTATLEPLIPNIPYEAARGFMEDQEDELSETLPELLYYSARDKGDPSGRALSLILAPAQDKAKEARANGETAILQTVKMCITISAHKRGFKEDAGSYDAGDFDDLIFEKRQILPQSDLEKAETDAAELANLLESIRVFRDLGLDTTPLKKRAAERAGIELEDTRDVAPEDPDAENPPDAVGRAGALMRELGVSGGSTASGRQVSDDGRVGQRR